MSEDRATSQSRCRSTAFANSFRAIALRVGPVFDERQVLHVEECDVSDYADYQQRAAGLNHLEHTRIQRSASD